MSWIKRGAMAGTALLALAAPAYGQSADRQEVTAGFTTTRPNTPTGGFFTLRVRDPNDPSAKAPRVTRVVEIFPNAPTDPSALPQCTASDAQLMAQGGAACPADSLDATGLAEFDTGFGGPGDPLLADLQAFYNGHGLSGVATPRGAPVHFSSHTEFQGRVATTDFPDMPGGPPDGHTTLRYTALNAPPHGNFFKTPATCPASGHWTFRTRVTYADGVTQETVTTSPCARPAQAARPKRKRHRTHRGASSPRFTG